MPCKAYIEVPSAAKPANLTPHSPRIPLWECDDALHLTFTSMGIRTPHSHPPFPYSKDEKGTLQALWLGVVESVSQSVRVRVTPNRPSPSPLASKIGSANPRVQYVSESLAPFLSLLVRLSR